MNNENSTPVKEMNKKLEMIRPYLPYIRLIIRLIEKAEEMDKVRAKIHTILFVLNTKERMEALGKVHNEWFWANEARKIVRGAVSGEEALARLTSYGVIEKIEKGERGVEGSPILAQMIRKIGIDPRELQLLIRLQKIVRYKNKTRAIAVLSKPQLFEKFDYRLKSFGDKKLADALLNSLRDIQKINRIGSEKIEFMKKFLISVRYGVKADGTPWTHSDYVNVIGGFLAELRSKYNEEKLAEDIKETNAIKYFIYYRSTIALLKKSLGMIKTGMEQGMWEQFEAFIRSLDKEESVLHRLGDDRTAGELKAEEKKVHEAPKLWEGKIKGIIAYKNTPRAFEDVRKGAIRYLFKILSERASELNSEMVKKADAALKELNKRVDKRMKKIENGKKIAMDMIKLRQENLWGELKATKKAFEERENRLTLIAMRFKKISGVFGGHTASELMTRIEALTKSKKQWANYARQNISRLQRGTNAYNMVPLTSAYLAVHQLERTEDMLVESERIGMNIMLKIPSILIEANSTVREFMRQIEEINEFLKGEGFMTKLEVGEGEGIGIRHRREVMINGRE